MNNIKNFTETVMTYCLGTEPGDHDLGLHLVLLKTCCVAFGQITSPLWTHSASLLKQGS